MNKSKIMLLLMKNRQMMRISQKIIMSNFKKVQWKSIKFQNRKNLININRPINSSLHNLISNKHSQNLGSAQQVDLYFIEQIKLLRNWMFRRSNLNPHNLTCIQNLEDYSMQILEKLWIIVISMTQLVIKEITLAQIRGQVLEGIRNPLVQWERYFLYLRV